jgi:hypothetical protein
MYYFKLVKSLAPQTFGILTGKHFEEEKDTFALWAAQAPLEEHQDQKPLPMPWPPQEED